MTETVIKQYFLRVEEHRTATPPTLPHQRIDVVRTAEGLFDQITIANARLAREEWLIVQPFGYSWTIHDDSSDKQTIFRRRHYNEHELAARGVGRTRS